MGLVIRLLLAITLFSSGSALAAEQEFSWLPNDPENLTGYRILYGTDRLNLNQTAEVGLPATVDGRVHYTVTGLTDGAKYYFVCVAYSDNGTSGPSAGVIWKQGYRPAQTTGFQHVDLNGPTAADVLN